MLPAFFEGPEKKVEITLAAGTPSLRSLPAEAVGEIVAASRATILSKRSNAHFDAYLLAESSLFVYDTYLTMITCGRTRLVDGVEALFRHVPRDAIRLCIFERKNEHFPHEQPTTFYEDARRLHSWLGGSALRFGVEDEHALHLFATDRSYEPDDDDVTIEVLMHGISEDVARLFRGSNATGAGSRASQIGLDTLVSSEPVEVDEFAFQPAGYSMNGMRDKTYVSLHVTPSTIGSYVSFETNADVRADPDRFVSRVVERFRPDSFDVVSFVPGPSPLAVSIGGYDLRRHMHERVCGYEVTFQHFFRPTAAVERPLRIELGG
jgi:S-adenosylmethionine decarboxylase